MLKHTFLDWFLIYVSILDHYISGVIHQKKINNNNLFVSKGLVGPSHVEDYTD